MKSHEVLWVAAALSVTQLALADVPFSSHSLGMLESTLAFCAESNSTAAPKYQERATLMVRGIPEKELAKARDTEEYKGAYSSIASALAAVPKEQVEKTCAELLRRNDRFAKGDK